MILYIDDDEVFYVFYFLMENILLFTPLCVLCIFYENSDTNEFVFETL